MRIRDLLAPESICLNGAAADKKDVLNQMVDLMEKSGKSFRSLLSRSSYWCRTE